ncbi:MAG: ATP-dependent DNA helicase [Sandaracinaceae bacterium]|nr:ATP-dependent DNA helicase [Sandaracinaceae bacterium]
MARTPVNATLHVALRTSFVLSVALVRAREALGPNGPFSTTLPGYEHRESQLAMADAVERALDAEGVLLVEAGTGTGKTLAYLVPAILSGKRVVISTGTKTLQDQIMERDLPFLSRHLGVPVNAACMKGLGNYLCLRRYNEFKKSPEANLALHARALPVLQKWSELTASGDRAELDALAEDAPIWSHVWSGSETRIGARCTYFEDCFVTNMRRNAEAAQILVVNHHLFFADLATRNPGGGGILPQYDAVVFDEAHQIEDIATEFFGVRVSTTRIETFVRDAQRALSAAKVDDGADLLFQNVLNTSAGFFSALPRGAGADQARAMLNPEVFTDTVKQRMFSLDAALEALAAHCKARTGASEAVAQVARRATQIRDDVATIAEGDATTHVNWTEQRGRSVSIGASPVDISALMRDEVLNRTRAVVFTSATLSTSSSFNFVKRRLGIEFEVDELMVPSPFEYQAQAALYLPQGMPDPRDANYFDAATREVVSLVELTGGGAFVLCTSLRAMNELAKRATPLLKQTIFVQGTAPKGVILDSFRRDGHAVLFATASFWEGVDVPGDALRLVIIDKLPFDVPSDPLVVARCKRIEDAGEQPFMTYLVPSAAISLKQGFGRLIRSQNDRGIVAILDRRITTKGYGKVFLRSLPDAARCSSREEVTAFWKSHQSVRPSGARIGSTPS